MKLLKKTAAALCAALTISAAASAAPLAPELQVGILAETATGENGWFTEPEQDVNWQYWYYTVTDLDRDGKLEIFKARNGWGDIRAAVSCEELSEDGTRRFGEISFVEGTGCPSLLTGEPFGQPLALIDEENHSFHYIFSERRYRNEFEWTDTKYALTFRGETLEIEELACSACQLSGKEGGITRQTYFPLWRAPSGGEEPEKISERRYAAIEQERFPGCGQKNIALYWYNAETLHAAAAQGELPRALESAYLNFARNFPK